MIGLLLIAIVDVTFTIQSRRTLWPVAATIAPRSLGEKTVIAPPPPTQGCRDRGCRRVLKRFRQHPRSLRSCFPARGNCEFNSEPERVSSRTGVEILTTGSSDDATLDGNMNLKVDTTTTDRSGFARSIILFHLRMYDLKSRDFSLRRYCRDSGREICHCVRKSTKHPVNEKFTVQRSLGQAFAALKSKADVFHHHNSSQSEVQKQPVELQRHDSGYDSTVEEEDDDDASSVSAVSNSSRPNANSSDPINIEFLNYAHVNVRRRGLKGHKRYDFDYWGEEYSWNVAAQKVGHLNELWYTLLRRRDGNVVARVFPQPLSEVEARAEAERGGWIAPCRMRITDEKLLVERNADLADVIVTTGLIALVDDGIRRHFHTSGIKQLVSPLSKLHAHRHRRATVMPVEKSGETGVRQ